MNLATLILLSLAPAQPPPDPAAALARLEAAAARSDAALAQIRKDNEDVLGALRRLDGQLAVVRGDVSSLGVQVTRLDARLSALERGAVQPFRAPAVLTDPAAAAAAGRQVGLYDGFGRLVAPAQTPLPAPAFSVQQQPVQLRQSAGGCGSDSCGTGRRTPVRNFLFGRR